MVLSLSEESDENKSTNNKAKRWTYDWPIDRGCKVEILVQGSQISHCNVPGATNQQSVAH